MIYIYMCVIVYQIKLKLMEGIRKLMEDKNNHDKLSRQCKFLENMMIKPMRHLCLKGLSANTGLMYVILPIIHISELAKF